MRLDPGSSTRVLPSPLIVGASNTLGKLPVLFVIGMWRELMPMQHYFCFGKRGNNAAYRRAVASQSWTGSAQHFTNIKSVSTDKRLFKKLPGDIETDKMQISRRRKVPISEFLNVKSKFGSNMTVRALVISDNAPKLTPQLGKFDGGRWINHLRVANRVSHVVRQSADGERIFVDGAGVPEKPRDEVAGAYVMGQVAEKLFTEGI